MSLSGYQEKFYFNPGDTGFKVLQYILNQFGYFCLSCIQDNNNRAHDDAFVKQVFQTKFAKIGTGKKF